LTALTYRPKLGTELDFIGPTAGIITRPVRIMRLETWFADTYRPDGPVVVLMGRNGRPRNLITLPGYGAGVKPPNAGRRYPPEPLSREEALALLNAIPLTTKAGIRNRALIALLWRTGLRIAEALALKPHHVDFQMMRVTVLHGKGDKRRTVGVDAYGLHELQPWLFERAMLDIPPTAPLFCTIQRPGRGGEVHDAYVRTRIHKYGALAGIPKRVHPHGLRHSIACDLIRERFGITDVQAQLGHSSPATTALYLRGMGADEAFEKVAARPWPGATP
jgi:site-specific recombinase XerC